MANKVQLISVEPSLGMGKLAERLKKSPAQTRQIVTAALRDYGRDLEDAAAWAAPKREVVLANTIQAKVERPNTANVRLVLTAGSRERPEVVVRTILFGSKPHDIFPKRPGGFLAFRGRDGKMHFARSVSHPGTKPNNFLKRAMDRTAPQRRSLSRLIGKLIVDSIEKGDWA